MQIKSFSFDRENLAFELLQTISDSLAPSFQALHPKMPVVYFASRSPYSAASDIVRFYRFIYDGVSSTIYYSRKKEIFDQYYNRSIKPKRLKAFRKSGSKTR